MKRNYFLATLLASVWFITAWSQTCSPVDINTTATNPEGISQYECINVSGVFNPDSPWPTEPIYPVWSGTQINVGGETRISAENADAVTLFVDPTPIYFTRLVPATGNALKFEKVEFGLRLPAEAETRIQNFVNETPSVPKLNPFDPLEVDIRAEFEYEFSAYQWETRGKQYGFYYREYELDTTGAGPTWHRNEIPVTEKFRVRYAPDKTGNWRVRFVVYLNGIGTYTTLYSYFFVAPSGNPGYVKVSADGRYFEQGDEFFYPVGQNEAAPECVSEYCFDMGYSWGPGIPFTAADPWSPEWWGTAFTSVKSYRFYHQVLEKMKAGGANYFRLITNEQGLDIEFEKLGNYYNRMPLAWEMDRILDKSKELGLYMTLDMALQTRYENGSVYAAKAWDWPLDECTNRQYCYNTIPGVDVPTDMLTNETAKRYFKNRLRYMVARYGYSTNIAIYELASEINNMGQGKIFGAAPNCNAVGEIIKPYTTDSTVIPHRVYKWQDEMLGYIKNDLQHSQHPMGVCYADDNCRADMGDSSYYSPNVDYIGFNNGGFHLNRFAWLKSTFLPKYSALHKPLIHSEITYVKYSDCEQYTEWYKNIWVPPFLGLSLATNWTYQHHLSFPYVNIYGSLAKFLQGSDFRNVNGYTWENDKQDQDDDNLGYKAFMYFMKGVNGQDKRAEGVVLSRNFNFYTNRVHNTPCDTATWSELHFLNFVPSDTIPEDVPYDPSHKLKIPDMNVNGVTQCYKVYWYDPAAGEWFYVKEQYSNVLEGYLTIEHPTLTSQIPGWQNMDLHSGIRPLLAFKVRRCDQDPPEGTAEAILTQEMVGVAQSEINREAKPEELSVGDADALGSGAFIRIFPNPTTDMLQVETSEAYFGAAYQLFSATASVVEEGHLGNNSVHLSLSGLVSGMYVLKVIRRDGHTETFKIVKQ